MPISTISASNYSSTAYTLWFLDRSIVSGLKYHVGYVMNLPANSDAVPFRMGNVPLTFQGGVRVIKCATQPTNTPNSVTSGVANAIGSTSAVNVMISIVQG